MKKMICCLNMTFSKYRLLFLESNGAAQANGKSKAKKSQIFQGTMR